MKISRMLTSWPRSLLFKTPYTCNIKITTRCNLQCGFCGLWSLPAGSELPIDTYAYIADLLDKLGLARVVITGGEPLLRNDAADILSLFSRRGFSTTLLTNGTLLTPYTMKRLVKLGLNDIGISLDTLNTSKLDHICHGKNIRNKIIDAIKLSVDSLTNGIVEVLTTVTSENLMDIPDIVSFVHHKLGAWSVINPVNIPPGDSAVLSASKPQWAPPFPDELVDSVYDRLIGMKRSGVRILVSDTFLEDSRYYLKTGCFKWDCDAGERYFTIFPDGSLAPCSDQLSIRSVLTMTPHDFRSAEYIRTVRDVQKRCGGCIFSCWREASYLFSRQSVWKERLVTMNRFIRGR
ncbi:radical SAM protein [bacterium]|nr:radical SAM protein [candidate division CSSED10-310 bacterium]